MIRNLKAPSIALLAVFALGAIGGQVASAHEFKSDGQKSVYTAANIGTQVLLVGSAGSLECKEAKFAATVDAGAGRTEVDEVTVAPIYDKCVFGGQGAPVFVNHCAYLFDSDTTAGNSTGGEHANIRLECAAGNKIQIHTVNCTITIGEQEVKDAVRYVNDGASAFETILTAHGIVVGKERSTASQAVNGCLVFPIGPVLKYIGTATYKCFQDEGSPQANSTTPGATQDATTTACSVS